MVSRASLDLGEMGSALPWQGGREEGESGEHPGVPKGGKEVEGPAPPPHPGQEGKWAAGGDMGVSRGLEGGESRGGLQIPDSEWAGVGVVGRRGPPAADCGEERAPGARGVGGRSSPGSRSGSAPRCTRRLSCSTSCGALRRKVSSRRSMLTSALSNSIRQ